HRPRVRRPLSTGSLHLPLHRRVPLCSLRILAQNCFRSTLIPRREISVCPRSVLFRKLGRAFETAQPYTKADFRVSTERATLSAAELPRSFLLRRPSCLFPESRRLRCASVAESVAAPTRKPRRST